VLLRKGALEIEGHRDVRRLANGRQEADPLVANAPQRDLQDRRRGGVEPLQIVDGDDDRTVLGERVQDV
jgi:hypothetical protein